MPPLLVVLFLTRRQEGERYLPRDGTDIGGVPPRVAVVRSGLVHPIELPTEREGAARLLGALALPSWAHNDEFAPGDMGRKRSAEDVRHSMRMSAATESRARQKDLGPALEAAGLRPSDYLDVHLMGNRDASRELRNACDDVSLLVDAEHFEEVRWILDTAKLRGNGEPDVAMPWLWDSASKEHVLDRFRELEALAARSTSTPGSGWQLAASDALVAAREEGEATGDDAEEEAEVLSGPPAEPRRRFGRYLVGAAAGFVLVLAVLGVRAWSDDPVRRPPGVELRVDNRTTSGRHVREDPDRLPLTTRPVPNCGSRGCVVEDSPTWESKQQIDRAVCQQQGERITNGDDGSKLDDDNPLLDDTRLYYGIMLPDGTTGYVAEVWIARDQRGSLGLPPCSKMLPRLSRR